LILYLVRNVGSYMLIGTVRDADGDLLGFQQYP
jgi:hypothetical protein